MNDSMGSTQDMFELLEEMWLRKAREEILDHIEMEIKKTGISTFVSRRLCKKCLQVRTFDTVNSYTFWRLMDGTRHFCAFLAEKKTHPVMNPQMLAQLGFKQDPVYTTAQILLTPIRTYPWEG